MALKKTIQDIVQSTMKLLKDQELALSITYHQMPNISYNPTTGLPSTTTTVYNNITAVLTTFSLEEKTEDVVVITDRKALISYNDLKTVLTANDYFIDNKTGERWEVKKIMGFPGEPLHKLHVRKV